MSQSITSADFGFLPAELAFRVSHIVIQTRPDLEEAIASVRQSEGIEDDWIYAPPQQQILNGMVRELPYPSRVFGLPKTHVITQSDQGHGLWQLQFYVWALSFFLGMRLTTTEAGFLDATPIVPGNLIDFSLPSQDLPKAIALADEFWLLHRSNPAHAKRFAAAVHALFLGQCPQYLQFERFIYLYTALDACYALTAASIGLRRKKPSHSARIAWMCDQFGIPIPHWALKTGSSAEIANLRNPIMHEALFVGEPFGFAIHGVGLNQNLPLEMKCLLCRLLVALIGGEQTAYIKSPVNRRVRYRLELP